MTEWPIFFKEEIKVGNLDSSVGICTLWTKKEIIHSKVPKDKYAICGNLYTVQGINPWIKNILSKPSIQHIVLCGADLMQSGDALINFINNGMDNDRKIIGSSGYIDSNVDKELIDKLRENVSVVDMRGRESEVPDVVNEFKNRPPFMEPIFIKELDKKPFAMHTDEINFKVTGKDIQNTWLKMIDTIMKFGEEKETEYNIKQKEILNLIAVVENEEINRSELKTESLQSTNFMNITEKDKENYIATFFTEDKPDGVEYTYGNRLYKHPPTSFNQIKRAIDYLKKVPFTRRAVAVTWNVDVDKDSKVPPCITQIVWNVKNNKLYQTVFIRSNDIFGAWPLNAYALQKLQKDIAVHLNLGVGSLTTVSTSAHIYDNNWKEAQNIIEKNHKGKSTPFGEDNNGYFTIKIEKQNGADSLIEVEHFTKEGLPTGYVFHNTKAQPIFRQIINENLISLMDHAAYVGYELARAEAALREGKKFKQDELNYLSPGEQR